MRKIGIVAVMVAVVAIGAGVNAAPIAQLDGSLNSGAQAGWETMPTTDQAGPVVSSGGNFVWTDGRYIGLGNGSAGANSYPNMIQDGLLMGQQSSNALVEVLNLTPGTTYDVSAWRSE